MRVKFILYSLIAGLSLLTLGMTQAEAKCVSSGGRQSPGDAIVYQNITMTEKSKRCGIGRRPCVKCALKYAEIAEKPRYAKLVRESAFKFRLMMSSSGSDKFSINWCESKPGNPNECYVIKYTVTK